MTAAVPLLVVSLMAAGEQVLIFVDGARMDIDTYEVRGPLVMLRTPDGKFRSVPRSYIDLAATESFNRASPSRETMRTETIDPERVVPDPSAPSTSPQPPLTQSSPRLEPSPPVWSDESLRVSLVVPSSDWLIRPSKSSPVVVGFEHERGEARATLTVIRGKLQGRQDFERDVDDIRSSFSSLPEYRPILDASSTVGPYSAHELRWTTTSGDVESYHRTVVVYSRDVAYVLDLTCPSVRREENAAGFDAFVRGLVLKKSSRETSF